MSSRYLAMWGKLQISAVPHRLRWVAEQDKARWDRQHSDKPAEIRERCSCQVGDHLCHQCQVDSRIDRWGVCSEHCERCQGTGFMPATIVEVTVDRANNCYS